MMNAIVIPARTRIRTRIGDVFSPFVVPSTLTG